MKKTVPFAERDFIVFTLIVLHLLFSGCTTSNHVSGFYNFKSPDPGDEPHYVLMKDSFRVYGDKINFPQGIATKNTVLVDGKSIPPDDVLGFQNKEGYWAKVERNGMARRLVKGKISVYRQIVD